MQSVVPGFQPFWLLAALSLSEVCKPKCEIEHQQEIPTGHGLITTSIVTAVAQSVRTRHRRKMCHKVALS